MCSPDLIDHLFRCSLGWNSAPRVRGIAPDGELSDQARCDQANQCRRFVITAPTIGFHRLRNSFAIVLYGNIWLEAITGMYAEFRPIISTSFSGGWVHLDPAVTFDLAAKAEKLSALCETDSGEQHQPSPAFSRATTTLHRLPVTAKRRLVVQASSSSGVSAARSFFERSRFI